MNINLLKELVLQPNLIRLADTYTPYLTIEGKQTYKDILEAKLNNLETGEFLIPVLGIQGTGKSSLLNALLMEDLVLPVDADETTCIPVEIRYGRHNDGEVHVYFEGRNDIERFYDKTKMEQYVHNRFNPGNEKQVSHIVIYKNDNLLANQVVLVDLPGVGSMTARNVETTMHYIEKLSGAIFLLRTVPPITRPERIFLTHTWPKLSNAWFIQNQWNDESKEEVADGKEHNLAIIKDIATQTKTKAPEDLRIINVYKGLNARLEDDLPGYQASGMQELRLMLEDVSSNWKSVLTEGFKLYIRNLVQAILKKIDERHNDLDLSAEELRAKYAAQEREFDEVVSRNKRRIADYSDKLYDHRMLMSDYAITVSKQQEENLRSEMRRIIGSGVVDGELLNRAFTETRDSLMEDTLEEFSLKLFEIQKDTSVLLEDLEIQDINGEFDKTSEFHKKESFKFEKAIPSSFGIAGSLLGLKVGTLVGSALGPLGSVVGGIGGVVVGTGIAILSSWLGIQAKKKIVEVRQKYTLQDLEEPIRSFRHMLKTHIETACDEMFDRLDAELRVFKKLQEDSLRNDRTTHSHILQQSEADVEKTRKQLEEESTFIVRLEEQLV
ncbi:dynamin family protein [Paenibacillus sp. 37]|uniref:dynamin family protein n=1 Tax=Paenibacillus sp. 37 TaxID=2607911 RepID=UPI00122DC9DE|nr:dynamin family protein [Paenibacillus sp. 37]